MPDGAGSQELFLFGCGSSLAPDATAAVVGNKAANLMRMSAAGLPVPAGFVLPTALCRDYLRSIEGLEKQVGTRGMGFQSCPDRIGIPSHEKITAILKKGIAELEKATGLTLGGERRPLLVSVRSGAAVSMPGMLDTVLNVGLCDRTLPALVRMIGLPRHAWDCYRRLIQAYAEVVAGMPAGPFERILDDHVRHEAVPSVAELDVAALKSVASEFLELCRTSRDCFPQDPLAQLAGAALAVFRSWQSPRAIAYRKLHGLDDAAGTAVTVQTMVFGNMGNDSGSGVGFTRDPATGSNELYMDFLWNAQGEDVVSGRFAVEGTSGMEQSMPELYDQLRQSGRRLEELFGDAQDFEFTVQEGRLFLLQARAAKRTDWAALRIAVDLVEEKLIDEETALERLGSLDLDSIRIIRLAAADGTQPLAAGIPASPGVAVGEAALSAEAARALAEAGRPVILVREDISTADIAGLAACTGILTARGGRTSHAAVVARQLNKVCIVGCRELSIDGQTLRVGDRTLGCGAALSLDGHTGRVFEGRLAVIEERPTRLLEIVAAWKTRRLDDSLGRQAAARQAVNVV